MQFTLSQQKVIDFDNGNLVVSASAGSGKTTVMIDRLIRLICQGKTEIDKILAVTFTKLASSEMKEKIAKEILNKLKTATPSESVMLKKQLEDLPQASISTVHSFCSNLIKTYFYVANVNPQFSIIEEVDQKMLMQQAISEVFERLYDEADSDILLLIKNFMRKHSDGDLRKAIIALYSFAVSEKDVEEFLDKSVKAYQGKSCEDAYNRLIREFSAVLKVYGDSMERLSIVSGEHGLLPYVEFFSKYAQTLYGYSRLEDFSQMYSAFKSQKLSRPKMTKYKENESLGIIGEAFVACKDSLGKQFEKFNKAFGAGKSEQIKAMQKAGETVKALVRITKLFIEKYTELKTEISVLDYNDLEHLALKILQNDEVCNEVAEKYTHIFVDEYQDTNGVQEAIFSKIERNNLFIVGDVKQSIYGFRGCNSKIFGERIKLSEPLGAHVSLDSNFRSAKSVIDATNKVFSCIMTPDSADIDYKSNPMICSNPYGEYQGEALVHVVDDDEKEDLPIQGVYSVGKHLKVLKSKSACAHESYVCDIVEDEIFGQDGKGRTIPTRDGERAVNFDDVVILTRSKEGLADRILAELVKRGIPVLCDAKRTLGEYAEIKFMKDLLGHIVSPTSDIPLASVLSSVIGGFSNNELSKIRKKTPKGSFYDACQNYLKDCADDIRDKLYAFFSYFEKIRLIAQFDSASRVLKRIITESGYELSILSSKLGGVKMDRVNRFIASGEELTVYEMRQKVDALIDSMSVAQISGSNAVKIMSYHASKGLEFPIVILADVSKKFNTKDRSSEILLDRELGIGVKLYDTEKMVSTSTSLRSLIAHKKASEQVTEEMRLFYVAMTRAKCKLHLIVNKPLSAMRLEYKMQGALKMYDFLQEGDLKDCKLENVEKKQELERRELLIGAPDSELSKQINEFLNYEYPYLEDTTLHLKRTVTQVVSTSYDNLDNDSVHFETAPLFDYDPAFVGTSYHRYLENCDFTKSPDSELIRLFSEEKLTKEQLDVLEKEKIENLLKLDVFQKVCHLKLYREQPFIMNVPASVIGAEGSDDVLLQGIIDLLAVGDGIAYIIDYKYSVKDDESLRKTYEKQLELYAYAVSKLLGVKIAGVYLVNINKATQIILF